MSALKRDPAFWRRFFMDMAVRVSLLSKDPDRKVGAVLHTPDRRQVSFGYNGLPAGVADTLALLYNKADKNALMVHAERNCLEQCPFPTRGCTLTVTRFPCEGCAGLIIQAGISAVIAPAPDFGHPRWGESWCRALGNMRKMGILVTFMEIGE